MTRSPSNQGQSLDPRPSPDRPVEEHPRETPDDALAFLGLVPESHRPDHDLRHDFPLKPDRCFTSDPQPSRPDIA